MLKQFTIVLSYFFVKYIISKVSIIHSYFFSFCNMFWEIFPGVKMGKVRFIQYFPLMSSPKTTLINSYSDLDNVLDIYTFILFRFFVFCFFLE